MIEIRVSGDLGGATRKEMRESLHREPQNRKFAIRR